MNLKKNYLYNIIYQIITIIIPLITVPYVSRVLGSEGIGLNAYSNSLVQYFVLIGTLGTSLYGNRTIAYVRENRAKMSTVFWSLFLLRIITTSLALVAFFIFIFSTNNNESVFLLQSFYILAAAADISWLFMGLEDFKKTVVRNSIVKLISVLLIFLFVKNKNDLSLYILILGASQFFGQLTMWRYVPKVVDKFKVTKIEIRKHILPSIQLFIPQAAIQVYIILNKTMLGIFSTYNEVGYFENADKVVKIILSIVTALGVVMLPRISNTFSKGDLKQVNEYIYKSFKFVTYLATPLAFGLAGIAKSFTPIYFGSGFEKTGEIIMIICPIIIFIAWSNVLGQQFLLPTGQTKFYTFSVVCGAMINLCINFLLVKRFSSYGVSVGTLVAEFSVTIIQILLVRKQLSIKTLFRGIWKYLFSGIVMFGVVQLLSNIVGGLLGIAIQIVIGAATYFILMFLLKDKTNKRIFGEVFSALRKK